ncbi:Receptor-like protein kinase HSL1 [Acorus calamus]|uniref:Receptor-like protein kinase HSL1 n=1 Tax=Acorus calamus TaxID=4465 RepID=A0AAV9EP17_ACOCL|nr:Receptor-like protein kinase HSL1 [Acorus calamus]
MAPPNGVTTLISLLLLLFTHSSSQQQHDLPSLLDIRNFWGVPLSTLWNSSLHYCSWPGIQCNPSSSVTELSLFNLSITSLSVPPSLCRLPLLSSLDLSWNYLGGPFPTTLYNCTNLEALNLSQNVFVGPIPTDADRLSPNLTHLDLSSNNFSGAVPSSLARLTSLVSLTLHSNLLDGAIADLGNLTNLETLTLAYNPFPPHPFPDWIGRLSSLKDLWLRSTNLVGPIPASLVGLSSLEAFDASLNGLTGPIPGPVWRMGSLKHLILFKNRLSGAIDGSVNFPNLIDIDLSLNDFSGPIPPAFGGFRNLQSIVMYNNHLSGPIPDGIGRLPLLRDVRLFNNNMSGTLPSDLGLYSKLWNLELDNNGFSGEIPANICYGGNLSAIVLFNNRMSGPLPASLASCKALTAIQIYDNGFSGPVPVGVWSLPALATVMISGNSFSGGIPDSMTAALTRLQIDGNAFSGPLPSMTSSPELRVLVASRNGFSGAIPPGIASLAQLQKLALDGNQLSGPIPNGLGGLTSLTFLNLSHNEISGRIPDSIGSLPVLTDLDLSQNALSGQIPPLMANLKLNFLNLSSNSLSGTVPPTLQNPAYERSFLSNPRLCGGPITGLPNCRAGSGGGDSSKGVSSPLVIALLALAGAIAVGAVGFTIWEFRRRRGPDGRKSWKLTSFHSLAFTEASIVWGLSEENLIGCGGAGKVYRVPIGSRPGEAVAVKRLFGRHKLDARLEREFESEIAILGCIRHANIVKLLCCVSSDDAKLLVYEYMENGSLDRWIHGDNGSDDERLDWPTRMEVAVGAAQGLAYMHHDCVPPVVHRDVKSSNILLCADFKARVADFGLARMLASPGEPRAITSAFAGSFGYMAPECAYSNKVNEKMDVYSFGVVLLELVTGREASNGGGDGKGCLVEWAWGHVRESSPIEEAIDGTIRAARVEEMCMVFKLGLACTRTLPSGRPSMKDVEQILLRLRQGGGGGWLPKIFGAGKFAFLEYDGAPLLQRWGSRRKVRSESGGGDDDDKSVACNV